MNFKSGDCFCNILLYNDVSNLKLHYNYLSPGITYQPATASVFTLAQFNRFAIDKWTCCERKYPDQAVWIESVSDSVHRESAAVPDRNHIETRVAARFSRYRSRQESCPVELDARLSGFDFHPCQERASLQYVHHNS